MPFGLRERFSSRPFQYKLGDEGLETLVRELKEAGLMGIEAYYCQHTPEMTAKIQSLARRYELLLSVASVPSKSQKKILVSSFT